ncbi:MAG: hypothetical protein AAGD01_10800 [Acidobacteriota bacterium]
MRRRRPRSGAGSGGAEIFPASSGGGRGLIRRSIQPEIAVPQPTPAPARSPKQGEGGSCTGQLTDKDSFSWKAARFYLNEALGVSEAVIRQLRVMDIQCTGNEKMCFVTFDNGMRVAVSYAPAPAFIVVRRTDRPGPRREYSFQCQRDGRVVFQRRSAAPSRAPGEP